MGMKHSHKLSDAMHILIYLELIGDKCGKSSKQIADSVSTNAGVVRRIMAQLKDANIIETKAGVAEPRLARNPDAITLLDVYRAVEPGVLLQIDRSTNERCPVGANVQSILESTYQSIQQVTESAMSRITLSELIGEVQQKLR